MKTLIDDELYENLMHAYQVTEIDRLNEVLKRNGISDVGARRRICAEFADANGMFLDQGWLQTDEAPGRYWPELVFSARALDPEEGLGPMEQIVLPEYASILHESAGGNIHYYFEEHRESLGGLQMGLP